MMLLKKGDVFYHKHINNATGEEIIHDLKEKKKRLYIVLKVDKERQLYVATRIAFSGSAMKRKKGYYKTHDKGKKIVIKYDYFSQIKFKDVEFYPYTFTDKFAIINEIYEVQKKNKSLTRSLAKSKVRARKKRKKQKKALASLCMPKEKSVSSYRPSRGMKDPTYKGPISIVRG